MNTQYFVFVGRNHTQLAGFAGTVSDAYAAAQQYAMTEKVSVGVMTLDEYDAKAARIAEMALLAEEKAARDSKVDAAAVRGAERGAKKAAVLISHTTFDTSDPKFVAEINKVGEYLLACKYGWSGVVQAWLSWKADKGRLSPKQITWMFAHAEAERNAKRSMVAQAK